jgi:GGDEF domain-containing protein
LIAAFCVERRQSRASVRSGLTDVLTGWHNWRYFETRLQEELAGGGASRSRSRA